MTKSMGRRISTEAETETEAHLASDGGDDFVKVDPVILALEREN
jgi:hypothetical protein